MLTVAHRNGLEREIALLLSLCVAALGIAVLAGWAFEIDALKSVFPGLVTMKANTALLILFCGAALALLSRVTRTGRHYLCASFAGWFVAALSALTLAEYLFGRDLGIDQLLFRDARV